MTPRQFNEYQRQADVLEQNRIRLIHDQIDELQAGINECMRSNNNMHTVPDLQNAIEELKQQLNHGRQ